MAAILGNLWPLGGNTKDSKVASGYRGTELGTLGCHARTLTTALPPLADVTTTTLPFYISSYIWPVKT